MLAEFDAMNYDPTPLERYVGAPDIFLNHWEEAGQDLGYVENE
jgi:hypothetical protein